MAQQDSIGKLKETSFAFRKVAEFCNWFEQIKYSRKICYTITNSDRPAFRQAAPGHTSFFSGLHAIHQYSMPYILADKGVT